MLDFGCGAGRTLRHFLAEARGAEIWGADIDRASIEWLERSLCPPLRVLRCAPEPPLPFDAGSFDLAWAISVFTHLADTSIAWLLELHRLLAPGGLLVASYMGRWSSEPIAGEPWDEDRIGMNVLRADDGWESGGPMVLMSDWWLREHWGRAFELLDVAPQVHGQTWALLRRRDVTLSVEDVERPGDDPREYGALRHNLVQVRREQRRAADAARQREARLREEYEATRSWRVTRPLRAAASLARRLSSR